MFRTAHEILDTAKYLDLARSNMVAAWPKSYYRRELIKLKFFHKRMFVMNRPDDIQRVMVANASNYRKSLANRRSLKPLRYKLLRPFLYVITRSTLGGQYLSMISRLILLGMIWLIDQWSSINPD